MKKTTSIIRKALAMLLAIGSVFSSLVLNVSAASTASTVKVTTGKYFTFYNVGAKKYLNVYANQNRNNANVDVYAYDGTSGEDFKLTAVVGGYTLTPRCAPTKRVNIYGDVAKSGSNVCLWASTLHSTQILIPESVSGGYILRSANNKNLVLTATGNKNSSNVNVQTYSKGNKYQIWQSNAFSTISTSSTPTSNTSNSSGTANASKTVTSSKTLNLDWSVLKKTGQQKPYSSTCFCFALAYSRDTLDNKTHSWEEFRYENTEAAVASKASYRGKWGSTKQMVLKNIYEEINSGRPAIVCVDGGRSTGEHYVAVIGYTHVKNVDALNESNFLIIDSVINDQFADGEVENLGGLGYVLKKESKGYYYCISK